MPGKDGTGPCGMGSRSGRGFGPCAGNPGSRDNGFGMGFGQGRGCRKMPQATAAPGWMRFGCAATPEVTNPGWEKTLLENQANFLENQLQKVKDQLKKLEE